MPALTVLLMIPLTIWRAPAGTVPSNTPFTALDDFEALIPTHTYSGKADTKLTCSFNDRISFLQIITINTIGLSVIRSLKTPYASEHDLNLRGRITQNSNSPRD